MTDGYRIIGAEMLSCSGETDGEDIDPMLVPVGCPSGLRP